MKWIESVWAQGPLEKLRAVWKTSIYFRLERFRSGDGSEDTEEADFKKFLGNLAELDVPDDVDPTHDDFNRGEVKADKLIAMAEKYQAPSSSARRKVGEKGPNIARSDAPGATKRSKQEENTDDESLYDKNYRKFVSGRTAKEDWQPVLLTADMKPSKYQHQVYIREFFLLHGEINPPQNRDEFNNILKDTVRRYLEIFRHAPPFELFTAFLNTTTGENGPSIWKKWCTKWDHPQPDELQLRGKRGSGNKDFRWILWKTAHACAREQSDAETAAMAGAWAAEFGNTDDAIQMARNYRRATEGWMDEVKRKAAEFAEKAVAAAAAAAAAANAAASAGGTVLDASGSDAAAAAENAVAAAAAAAAAAAGNAAAPALSPEPVYAHAADPHAAAAAATAHGAASGVRTEPGPLPAADAAAAAAAEAGAAAEDSGVAGPAAADSVAATAGDSKRGEPRLEINTGTPPSPPSLPEAPSSSRDRYDSPSRFLPPSLPSLPQAPSLPPSLPQTPSPPADHATLSSRAVFSSFNAPPPLL